MGRVVMGSQYSCIFKELHFESRFRISAEYLKSDKNINFLCKNVKKLRENTKNDR